MKTINKIGCIGALVASLMACDMSKVEVGSRAAPLATGKATASYLTVDALTGGTASDKPVDVQGEVLGYAYDRYHENAYIALTLKGSTRPLVCRAKFTDYDGTATTLAALVQAEMRDGVSHTITVRGKYDGTVVEMYSVNVAGHHIKITGE